MRLLRIDESVRTNSYEKFSKLSQMVSFLCLFHLSEHVHHIPDLYGSVNHCSCRLSHTFICCSLVDTFTNTPDLSGFMDHCSSFNVEILRLTI